MKLLYISLCLSLSLYISIYFVGSENNFKKADTKRSNDFGVSYDFNSVMHYSEYAFSKNSRKTIEPKVIYFIFTDK